MLKELGFLPADILLPKGQDMNLWSVIACDQFTSQAAYWEAIENQVKQNASTLHMILPELYLGREDTKQRIDHIHETMHQYLKEKLFRRLKSSYVYVERTVSDGSVRRGLVGALDLEAYDYQPDSEPLCRATEGTVLERIPPRMAVRENAPLEMPHVMLLLDDAKSQVIAPLCEQKAQMEKVYDFSLMEDGGHIKGYVPSAEIMGQIESALLQLYRQAQQKDGEHPLLYLVGDGNHSLATAKACYEKVKKEIGADKAATHPARYALVELVNLHESALAFEPIHRVMFQTKAEKLLDFIKAAYPDCCTADSGQEVTMLFDGAQKTLRFTNPSSKWAVGTLQNLLDEYLQQNPDASVDYIHDVSAVNDLLQQPDTVGFLLPPIEKGILFDVIREQKILPRKAFSMGHARDKRYYLECREIM